MEVWNFGGDRVVRYDGVSLDVGNQSGYCPRYSLRRCEATGWFFWRRNDLKGAQGTVMPSMEAR